MKSPTLTGSIGYDDEGNIWAFVETESGPLTMAKLAIYADSRPFSELKKAGSEELADAIAKELHSLSEDFRHRRTDSRPFSELKKAGSEELADAIAKELHSLSEAVRHRRLTLDL